MNDVELHPLEPFLPDGTRLLMLGSFPPSRRRWSMEFFYPNFINDMWRIFGIVFFGDKEHFVDTDAKTFRREDIIVFLEKVGIGLYDTACAVRRTKNTASDKDLEIVKETDVAELLRRIPQCRAVVTTGQKATDVMTGLFGVDTPKVGMSSPFTFDGREMRLYRMPSSSRAYPLSIDKKSAYYERMFREMGLPVFQSQTK